MPLWSLIYLGLSSATVLIGILGWRSDEQEDERIPLILDVASAAAFGCLFVSYWIHDWRRALGAVAPILFMLAIAWKAYDEIRLSSPSQLSQPERRWILAFDV